MNFKEFSFSDFGVFVLVFQGLKSSMFVFWVIVSNTTGFSRLHVFANPSDQKKKNALENGFKEMRFS